jgi:hypothetical protein
MFIFSFFSYVPRSFSFIDQFAVGKAEWEPHLCEQSSGGMSCFLSGLFILVKKFSGKPVNMRKALISLLVKWTSFPPVGFALATLLEGANISLAEKAVLVNVFYGVFRVWVPEEVENENVFEQSRICFTHLWTLPGTLSVSIEEEGETTPEELRASWTQISIMCPLTLSKFVEPVRLRGEGAAVSKSAALARLPGGERFSAEGRFSTASEVELTPADDIQDVISAFPSENASALVLSWTGKLLLPPPRAPAVNWVTVIRASRDVRELSLVRALSLNEATPPCLTLNKDGNMCIYIGI